jgi:hypothetical protein
VSWRLPPKRAVPIKDDYFGSIGGGFPCRSPVR